MHTFSPQIEISCDIPKVELDPPPFIPFTSSSMLLIWLSGELLEGGAGGATGGVTDTFTLEFIGGEAFGKMLLKAELTLLLLSLELVGGERTRYGEYRLLTVAAVVADCLSRSMAAACWYAAAAAACCAISSGCACCCAAARANSGLAAAAADICCW